MIALIIIQKLFNSKDSFMLQFKLIKNVIFNLNQLNINYIFLKKIKDKNVFKFETKKFYSLIYNNNMLILNTNKLRLICNLLYIEEKKIDNDVDYN